MSNKRKLSHCAGNEYEEESRKKKATAEEVSDYSSEEEHFRRQDCQSLPST